MADEEYGSYGARRTNRAGDDEEEQTRSAYGESGTTGTGRYNRASSKTDSDRTMDEPDPAVPTAGYSLEATYGKGTGEEDESEGRKPSYGQQPSYGKPSKPTVTGPGQTMDEPDPVEPTQGYCIDSTYGSGKLETDDETSGGYGKTTSGTGYGQSGSGSYKKPASSTDDEATTGYSIDSTYGSGRKRTDGDDDVVGTQSYGASAYGAPKKDDDEEESQSGYGYGGKKVTSYGSGRKDEEDSTVSAYGGSTYGKKKDEDEGESGYGGYGGKKSSSTAYGEAEDSEVTSGGYGRTSAYKPSTYGSEEADPAVPTEGYSLQSTYGEVEDESSKPAGYGGRKTSSFGEGNDDESDEQKPKYGRKKHGDSESDDDEEKKSSYSKHGQRRGDDDEDEGKKSAYGDDDSEQSGRSKYGQSRYGRNDDEELVSSTAGLSLDSDRYSGEDSENRRRGDDDEDDDNRRGKHGHHHKKRDDDDETQLLLIDGGLRAMHDEIRSKSRHVKRFQINLFLRNSSTCGSWSRKTCSEQRRTTSQVSDTDPGRLSEKNGRMRIKDPQGLLVLASSLAIPL
ncbi:hypothetical protein AXG93_1998s1250 [Marchantia polymorpha subsp. ruderalis]|uniref:Uncharacterized protein n=2 Tax=Marchantia polymorpha TaxID=3197 RepID=A0A176VPV7_MARPO|nr:hypothetical protein AXG93_1998s1250 [Marchantia polymorpha subsp. ruderalis]